MKKVLLFAMLFVASMVVMTSCGGGETTTADTPEATEQENNQDATADADATADQTEAEAPVDIFTIANAEAGAEVYNNVCMACHNAGIAGAAKLNDKARWEASAAKGFETIKDHTLNGFTGEHGVMPAKGGRVDLTEEDMLNAIAYIFKEAGVNF